MNTQEQWQLTLQAAELYERYLRKTGGDSEAFTQLATEGLAYSYESMGQTDKAIEAFERLITPESKAFRERGLFNSARLYARSDNRDKALELYKTLLADYPESKLTRDVQRRVAELEAGA